MTAGLTYLAMSLLIQAQNYFLYLHRPADGATAALRFLGTLPLHQFQHLVMAALIVMSGEWVRGSRALRVAHSGVIAVLMLYVVVDQIAFQAFFGHFDLSLIDGAALDLRAARDSILAELPPTLWWNVAIWLGATVMLIRRALAPRARCWWPMPLARRRTMIAAAAMFITLSAMVALRASNYNLEDEPLAVLARSLVTRNVELTASPIPEHELYAMQFGEPTIAQGEAARLAAVRARLRETRQRPNIVMVITESVGAKQMFREGTLSSRITPNLAALSGEMAAFDSLYNTFPASMRGHLSLNTGGRTITWSHFGGPVATSYKGPTLVGQLKRLGYRSALVSAGEFRTESIDKFYTPLGYDYLYEPASEPKAFAEANAVHSWGIAEDVARDRAVAWIDRQDRAAPFFLQFLTISTHHPYAGPKSHRGPLAADDNEARYYNALHYVDAVIGRLLADLRARDLLRDTILVVTGDHGQAFGTIHRGNFYHQGFLFEENIRNYLLLAAPGVHGIGHLSRRAGSIGDIMPTILAAAGGDAGDVRGQDLLDPRYVERMAFFHKNVSPAQWGVRDGRWKFTSEQTSTRDAQLYDLAADPDEQRNLADRHPDRIQAYQRAARQWYIQTNQDYTARVAGYVDEERLSAKDLLRPGPKSIAFGSRDGSGAFQPLDIIHPEEDLVALTRWVRDRGDKRVVYRWIAPSGRQSVFSVLQRALWGETLVHSEIIEPMEEGTWTLSISEGERELLSRTFEVKKTAPLRTRMDPSGKEPRAPEGRR